MPIDRNLWSALWLRASREEIGIMARFSSGASARHHLQQHRPAGFEHYTVARTPDPNTVFIIKPGVELPDTNAITIDHILEPD